MRSGIQRIVAAIGLYRSAVADMASESQGTVQVFLLFLTGQSQTLQTKNRDMFPVFLFLLYGRKTLYVYWGHRNA